MTYLADVAALTRKDLRVELRGRDTLPAMLLFVLATLVVFHFALPEGSGDTAAYGLLLKQISDARLHGNRFAGNTVGLFAEGSTRLEVSENDFVRNGWAVRVMADARDAAFSGNNFVANTFDVSTNGRYGRATFDRNYWDAYRGYDLDRDGTGDVPFRPVRLFALIAEEHEPALLLLRSLFVDLLDLAERIAPALTPATLADGRPAMRPIAR